MTTVLVVFQILFEIEIHVNSIQKNTHANPQRSSVKNQCVEQIKHRIIIAECVRNMKKETRRNETGRSTNKTLVINNKFLFLYQYNINLQTENWLLFVWQVRLKMKLNRKSGKEREGETRRDR